MLRNYRNIGKPNNLIAMGGGLSQTKGESVLVKVKSRKINSFIAEIKTYIKLGGF